MFAPIAFENLGVPSGSTRQLLSYPGRRLTDISGKAAKPVSEMLSLGTALYFCMTVCQIVIARITRHTQLFVDFFNF